MLGVALNAQRAGWIPQGNVSITVAVTNASTDTYGIEQSPAFWWVNSQNDSPSTNYVNKYYPGNIDVSGYANLSGYNNNRWTGFWTFQIDFANGLASNQGMNFDTKFTGNSGDGDFAASWSWFPDSSGNLVINTAFADSVTLNGAYGNYNGQWMTVVACCSNTASSYSNWTGSGTGDYYRRTAVFNTQTGALISKYDQVTNTRLNGFPANIASWMANANSTISTNRSDTFSYSINISSSAANANVGATNQWFSIGTMFDPLTETDTSWRTTRPSKDIGNARAWLNIQYVDYDTSTGNVNGNILASGMDLFTSSSSSREAYLQVSGNATTFSDRFKTTNLPVWTG